MLGMEFHEKLANLCSQKGWDQSVLSQRTGFGKATINAWWNNLSKPSWERAWKLAQTLGVSLDFLTDDRLDKPLKTPRLTKVEKAVLRQARLIGVQKALEVLVEARIAQAAQAASADSDVHGAEHIPPQIEPPRRDRRSG